MTVADETGGERRRPGAVRRRPRRGCAHHPAGGGGERARLRLRAQEQRAGFVLQGGERQPAAGHAVDRLQAQFPDHGADRAAAQRLLHRP